MIRDWHTSGLIDTGRDFPRPDFGGNIGPFPIEKMSKNFQNGVNHSEFLSFGEYFMEV